jgi:hypothetical protein
MIIDDEYPLYSEVVALDNRYIHVAYYCLLQAPDYFWSIPASSTGKYHPKYALGEGGLVRHVKATIRIANELFNLEQFNFSDREKQLIKVALLLHDCYKNGINGSEYTVDEHPIIGAKQFMENSRYVMNAIDRLFVSGCILTHMGKWNKTREGKIIMPKPFTRAQKFVHLCDYLASRKFLEVTGE